MPFEGKFSEKLVQKCNHPQKVDHRGVQNTKGRLPKSEFSAFLLALDKKEYFEKDYFLKKSENVFLSRFDDLHEKGCFSHERSE